MAELKKRDLFKQMEDPYKIVMFYLVAQVKFGNASSLSKSVIRTVEDYLWFKVSLFVRFICELLLPLDKLKL